MLSFSPVHAVPFDSAKLFQIHPPSILPPANGDPNPFIFRGINEELGLDRAVSDFLFILPA